MKFLIMAIMLVGCGKTETVNNITNAPEKGQIFEFVECKSDTTYTECPILNSAISIINIDPKIAEDCQKGLDYYLLDNKTLVTINKCSAVFLLEVE